MGWTGGSEILEKVWPILVEAIPRDTYRYGVYEVLVTALEDQDADTLGEVVECCNRDVDPVLVQLLIDRFHLEGVNDEG